MSDSVSGTNETKGETMNTPDFLPTLSAGPHTPHSGEACVMEYVSLLAGEKWSDTPACTYLPLARAAQYVNDQIDDDERHLLVPLIGRLFGTNLPVDDRLFALRVARTVEHLSPSAKKLNDVTERFLSGEVSREDLKAATAGYFAISAYSAATAANSAYSAISAYSAATYADSAYSAISAANSAYSAANSAYSAAAYADSAYYANDLVDWLASIIDIYDELSGRTEHFEVSDVDLMRLAGMVKP